MQNSLFRLQVVLSFPTLMTYPTFSRLVRAMHSQNVCIDYKIQLIFFFFGRPSDFFQTH